MPHDSAELFVLDMGKRQERKQEGKTGMENIFRFQERWPPRLGRHAIPLLGTYFATYLMHVRPGKLLLFLSVSPHHLLVCASISNRDMFLGFTSLLLRLQGMLYKSMF